MSKTTRPIVGLATGHDRSRREYVAGAGFEDRDDAATELDLDEVAKIAERRKGLLERLAR